MANIKKFSTMSEVSNNNKLIRGKAEELNELLAQTRKDELNIILSLYLAYLKTPKKYIDSMVEKYGINAECRKIGAVFLLTVLESKTFRGKYQKWDSRKYGQWAKILTYFIEANKTFAQVKDIIENPKVSKYSLLTECSSSIVNETNYKKTIKQFRTIHKAQYMQGEYLIHIDSNGEVTRLSDNAIDLLNASGYFDKTEDVADNMDVDIDYTSYNNTVPLTPINTADVNSNVNATV